MKCLVTKCEKQEKLISVNKDEAIVPTECDVGELSQLFSYFQYRAPNIDSMQSPLIDNEDSLDDLLQNIIKRVKDYKFCEQNADINCELKKIALYGEHICPKCKRFLCKRMNQKAKRRPGKKEHDLECFLRHIRNSIAHGNVFVMYKKTYISIIFEDLNEKKNTTARIACCQADLKKWRSLLNKAVND